MAVVALVTLLTGAIAQSQTEVEPAESEDERPDEVPLLRLDEAIALARLNAPAMRSAQAGLDIAEAQALAADFAFVPTLSGRITVSPAGPRRGNAIDSSSGTDIGAIGDIFDTFTYQLNSELSGTLPLYTFGKIRLAQDLAEVGIDVANLERRKAELEMVFDVTRAYLGLQLADALDELIVDGQRRLDDARAQLEDRIFEGQAGARTELRRLVIQEATFSDQIVDNRTLAFLAREGISYYCGIEGDFRVSPLAHETPQGQLEHLGRFVSLAYENRPDLSLLQDAVEAAEINADLQSRLLTPNLFFAFGLRFNRSPLSDDQPSPFAYDPYNSGGIGFNLGLDWRFDIRQVAEAREAAEVARQARAQRDEALGGIELEIARAHLEALGHEDRVSAYDEALQAAEAWLRQKTLQFDSGLADYDDLSEPLLAYFGAFASYHEALFDSRLARANLALKVGLERLEAGVGLTADDAAEPEPSDSPPE